MECEVCGKPINGSPRIVNIEGALMRVCANCTRYGKGVTSPKKAKRVERAPDIPPPQFPEEPVVRKKPRREQVARIESMEPIPNLSEVIKTARSARGWTQEELGKFVNVKASVIHKVEAGSFTPSIQILRKIEQKLGVDLLQKVSALPSRWEKPEPKSKPTLGDVVNIKEEKTKES